MTALDLDAGRALIAERRRQIATVRRMLDTGELLDMPVRTLAATLAECLDLAETQAREHAGLLDLLQEQARAAPRARH